MACGSAPAALLAGLVSALLGAGTVPAAAQQTPAPLPAASALPVRPVAPQPAPSIPAGRWTAAQVQQAFELADTDSNGELNRAEAQQLRILPRSFEDMDQNKDGILSREEYLDGTSR